MKNTDPNYYPPRKTDVAKSVTWLDDKTVLVVTLTETCAMTRLYTKLPDLADSVTYERSSRWSWWTEDERADAFLACPNQLPVPASALVVGF